MSGELNIEALAKINQRLVGNNPVASCLPLPYQMELD